MLCITTKKIIEKKNKQSFENGISDCKKEILHILQDGNFDLSVFMPKFIYFLDVHSNISYDIMDIDIYKNSKLKTILGNGKEFHSDIMGYKTIWLIAKLLGMPLYGYQKTYSYIGEIKYRGICGVAPEFGHDFCPDCIAIGGPEPVPNIPDEYGRVELDPQNPSNGTNIGDIDVLKKGNIKNTMAATLKILLSDPSKMSFQNTLIDLYRAMKNHGHTKDEIVFLSEDERWKKFCEGMI